jgi:hypothetical protein
VLGGQLAERERPMKKNSASKSNDRGEDELRPEYDLSQLKGGVRGKHAERYLAGTNLALLAPDVRHAFPTDEAVNEALRLMMANQNT